MRRFKNYFSLVVLFLIVAGCKHKEPVDLILPAEIKSHIAVLADDSLTGRKPFTAGETKAINYIASQFKTIGLAPGNNGSYFQDVPMVEITSTPSETMSVTGAKAPIDLHFPADFVASTRQELDNVQLINSPIGVCRLRHRRPGI